MLGEVNNWDNIFLAKTVIRIKQQYDDALAILYTILYTRRRVVNPTV